MTRRHILAGFLLIALMPTALTAGEHDRSQSNTALPAQQIKNLALQYVAAKSPEQRREIVQKLKSLSGTKVSGNNAASTLLNSADQAVALNTAISAMLPEAGTEAAINSFLEFAL